MRFINKTIAAEILAIASKDVISLNPVLEQGRVKEVEVKFTLHPKKKNYTFTSSLIIPGIHFYQESLKKRTPQGMTEFSITEITESLFAVSRAKMGSSTHLVSLGNDKLCCNCLDYEFQSADGNGFSDPVCYHVNAFEMWFSVTKKVQLHEYIQSLDKVDQDDSKEKQYYTGNFTLMNWNSPKVIDKVQHLVTLGYQYQCSIYAEGAEVQQIYKNLQTDKIFFLNSYTISASMVE